MYHAINKGLAMASGDILAYLNSDDLYFPWTVQTVVDAFARHPEADFVFGEALAIDEESGATQPYWMAPFDLDFVRREGFLPQPAVFWRRSAYESVGPFDTRYDYVADCAYWMRAGKDHKFHKVFEFLAIERNHAGTLRESLAMRYGLSSSGCVRVMCASKVFVTNVCIAATKSGGASTTASTRRLCCFSRSPRVLSGADLGVRCSRLAWTSAGFDWP